MAPRGGSVWVLATTTFSRMRGWGCRCRPMPTVPRVAFPCLRRERPGRLGTRAHNRVGAGPAACCGLVFDTTFVESAGAGQAVAGLFQKISAQSGGSLIIRGMVLGFVWVETHSTIQQQH